MRLCIVLMFLFCAGGSIAADEIAVSEVSEINEKHVKSAAKLKAELIDGSVKENKLEKWTIPKQESSTSMLGGKMFKGLAFCVGVALIAFAFIKRTRKNMVSHVHASRVVERVQLTQKSSLLIVEIDGVRHALTVGSEQVRQISLKRGEEVLPAQKAAQEDGRDRQKEGLELLCQVGNI